jgi:phosphoribosyl-ATP pyrophosphohydrolase/phosphoribosyl-AMP cyclohydrolase
VLDVVDLQLDCDRDTLLVLAHPRGPTCHLARESCFPDAPGDFLAQLDRLVERRAAERPVGSYTTRLLDGGVRRVAQKVGEEGVETALAAVAQDEAALAGEAADLLYHLLVLLRARDMALADVVEVLRRRHSGD